MWNGYGFCEIGWLGVELGRSCILLLRELLFYFDCYVCGILEFVKIMEI